MANQKLDDIFSYIETQGATIADLVGKIKVTKAKEPFPGVIKDYGLQAYLGAENPKEILRKKIGPLVHELWHINLDLVFNRNLKSRNLYSDAKGLSYWENLLTDTFMNQTNGGLFKDSFWEFLHQEDLDDAVILRGMLHTEVLNRY